MTINLKGIFCVLLFISITPAWANPLFEEDSVLNIVLNAPLSQAYAQKNAQDRLWMNGNITFLAEDDSKQTLDISIRTRGVFRRKNCKLPPLSLNFKKKQTKGSIFSGQDKLKLVSPCNNRKTDQQNLILEYLAYKAFSQLTDYALKTRMVRVSYIDSDSRRKPLTHYAFLIEHENDLAERFDSVPIHLPKISSRQLEQYHTGLVEVFQLMIANTDYSTIRGPEGKDCCHNIELIAKPNSDINFYPIPYDFDASGLVNAEYAAPSENLRIKTVRKRLFTGRCKPDEVWSQAIDKFKNKKDSILVLFEKSNELSSKSKTQTLTYLGKFFSLIENPNRINNEIIKRCRGKK